MGNLLHPERLEGLDPRLQQLFWDIAAASPHDVMVTPDGGRRFPFRQLGLFALGRKLVDGKWIVVDASKVVTHAQHPEEAPHCHGGAGDLVPVFPDGKIHWDAHDPLFPEYLRRQQAMGAFARARGFTWGGDWHWKDWDHFEVKDWASLPVTVDPPGAPG